MVFAPKNLLLSRLLKNHVDQIYPAIFNTKINPSLFASGIYLSPCNTCVLGNLKSKSCCNKKYNARKKTHWSYDDVRQMWQLNNSQHNSTTTLATYDNNQSCIVSLRRAAKMLIDNKAPKNRAWLKRLEPERRFLKMQDRW